MYKSGTGTRGRGHWDECVETWDLGTGDEGLEDIKYGTRRRVGRVGEDVKNRDSGNTGCEELLQKSEVNAISLSSTKSVIYIMVNIRFHLPKPHWTPYDNYTKYFFITGASAPTIVIRVRVDFHRRVIFPCVRA